jgi:hypothetical protein
VAYKLQLPDTAHIHPVVHVSQLKKALPVGVQANTDEALNLLDNNSSPTTPKVLSHRLQLFGNSATSYALVQWGDVPESYITWENVNMLHQVFPALAT